MVGESEMTNKAYVKATHRSSSSKVVVVPAQHNTRHKANVRQTDESVKILVLYLIRKDFSTTVPVVNTVDPKLIDQNSVMRTNVVIRL